MSIKAHKNAIVGSTSKGKEKRERRRWSWGITTVFSIIWLLDFGVLWAGPAPSAANTITAGEAGGEFYIKNWSTEDGLPQSGVQCLLQTRDGYMWVGTRAGLARFDGRRFEVFNRANTPAFIRESVLCLAEDPDGGLWVGTVDGLLRYKGWEWTGFDLRALDKRVRAVRAVAVSPDGTAWFGTDYGLFRWRSGKLEAVVDAANPDNTKSKVWDLKVDDHGVLWMTTDAGFERLVPGHDSFETLFEIGGMYLVSDRSDWWFSGGDAFCRWRAGEIKSWENPSSLVFGHPAPMAQRAGGGVWVLSETDGLGRSEGDRIVWTSLPQVPLRDANALLEDREGNLWVGSISAGLFRLRPKNLRTLSVAEGLIDNDAWSISAGDDGLVWIGTSAGICSWKAGAIEIFQKRTGGAQEFFVNNKMYPLLCDREGHVWLKSGEWLNCLRSNTFETVIATNLSPGVPGSGVIPQISSIHQGRSGIIWVGTEYGLYFLRRSYWEHIGSEEGLRHVNILGVLEDYEGNLWVGGHEGQVVRLQFNVNAERIRSKVEDFTGEPGLPQSQVAPVLADPDGTVWFGSANGLVRWKNNRFVRLTTAHGLHENIVGGVLEDGLGYLWLHGHRGIQRLRKSEVVEVCEGRRKRVEPHVFSEAEGMLSAECNVGVLPSGCRTSDGRLWFPTTRGVAIIDPRAVRKNDVPPPVVIEQVAADREVIYGEYRSAPIKGVPSEKVDNSKSARDEKPMRLRPGRARSLVFRYTGNSLSAPDRVRFRYKLEGHDEDWREDNTNLRTAFYTNLRPGSYRFVVRAFNNHGVPSVNDAIFAFRLAPHFYETWSFYVLCSSAVLLAAASLHYGRMSGLRRFKNLEQLHALEVERTRIARDMHDGLGTDLTKIAMLADMASAQSGSSSAPGLMEKVSILARSLVDGISELVWATNPRYDTVEDLAAFIRQYTSELLESAGIRARFDFPSSVGSIGISGEARRHLFLAVKEALTNAVKYAQATQVELSLSIVGNNIEISIVDNGRGFNLDETRSGHERGLGGNGLVNMRHRMKSMGGSCQIQSSPGKGTRVLLSLPLEISKRGAKEAI